MKMTVLALMTTVMLACPGPRYVPPQDGRVPNLAPCEDDRDCADAARCQMLPRAGLKLCRATLNRSCRSREPGSCARGLACAIAEHHGYTTEQCVPLDCGLDEHCPPEDECVDGVCLPWATCDGATQGGGERR